MTAFPTALYRDPATIAPPIKLIGMVRFWTKSKSVPFRFLIYFRAFSENLAALFTRAFCALPGGPQRPRRPDFPRRDLHRRGGYLDSNQPARPANRTRLVGDPPNARAVRSVQAVNHGAFCKSRGSQAATPATALPAIRRPFLSAPTTTFSPSWISPARINSANGSCTFFWMTRFKGRAP